VLNFGHTVGHALESLGEYRSFRHGEAVAVGMVAAARISTATGRLPSGDADELKRLVELYRLPTRIPGVSVGEILAAMRTDKKAAGGTPRFVLLRRLGEAEFGVEVLEDVVARALADLGAIP
jgi:3-dehydroquinate synthase